MAGAGAVNAAIVHTDELTIRGQTHIAFDPVCTLLDRQQVRGKGVLGLLIVRAAVGDDLGTHGFRVGV